MSDYYITATAMARYYMLATQSGTREVGVFAEFWIDEHGNIIITDTTVLKQESTSVFFEIKAETKGIWLEDIVSKGKNPAHFLMGHTHPSGMSAKMSSTDVDQLEELARDLPGTVARSMILSQGQFIPYMHEAVCIDGRVFWNTDIEVKILDDTGAYNDLKEIGWFDKPKPKPVQSIVTGSNQQHGRRELLAGSGYEWFNETPMASEAVEDAYSEWLDDKRIDEEAACKSYIGELIAYNGLSKQVVDAYIWDIGIVLVLEGQEEVMADEVTIIKSGWLNDEVQREVI